MAAPESGAASTDPSVDAASEEVAEDEVVSTEPASIEDQTSGEEEAVLDEEEEDDDADVEPLEFIREDEVDDEDIETKWYILKVQVNREDSIRDALERRVKIEGLERYFRDIVVPTEDIAEFTKTGKRRIVKKKLYPGYIMVNMAINDDTWFIVRETPGIGDFTGSAGRPAPMDPADVERILKLGAEDDDEEQQIKTAIPFKVGDRVRVKEGYFQNFEGDVEIVDEANGRVTVMINIFGRSTPVELEHWQIEAV
jgi:transcriptional antiterminator NusG